MLVLLLRLKDLHVALCVELEDDERDAKHVRFWSDLVVGVSLGRREAGRESGDPGAGTPALAGVVEVEELDLGTVALGEAQLVGFEVAVGDTRAVHLRDREANVLGHDSVKVLVESLLAFHPLRETRTEVLKHA